MRVAVTRRKRHHRRLTTGICAEAGARTPLAVTGTEFNLAAERYYRDTLRRRHLEEALDLLAEELQRLDSGRIQLDEGSREALQQLLRGKGVIEFFGPLRPQLLTDQVPEEELRTLIHLILVLVHLNDQSLEGACEQSCADGPSVHTA